MSALRVAIVGCGYWAPNIVRNLLSLRGVEVVALCDMKPDRARNLADHMAPRAAVVVDHRELCNDPSIDAAFVITPIRAHFPVACDLLQAGKHVFIEKPLAATVAEGEELIKLATAKGVVLMTGHVFEYNAAVIRIKQYLDSGELGRLLYVYSHRVNLGRIQDDVSALWSFAPHDVSILNYWLGADPVAVSARGLRYLGHAVEDVVFVLLEYPGGVGAHLHLGWMDPRKIRQMTLVGARKMLLYDDVSIDSRIQIYDKGVKRLDEYMRAPDSFAEFQWETRTGDVVIPQVKFVEPLHEECRHFIECVRTGARPRTDGVSGLRVVRVLEAAQRSLDNEGAIVHISTAGTQ
jgi:predicted dehydrogenase